MQRDEPVWTITAFDLPTKSSDERREATRYRNHLLHLGFSRVQLSVYAKYVINGAGFLWLGKQVGAGVPPDGIVRVIPVSDQEWARTLRFEGRTRLPPEPSPEQLTIF
jgi:CRISPR-associated protein Cas2